MILYPAIDIRDGRAVRLTQGDFGRETVYDADPLEAAHRWAAQGARFLHVVDLDGARDGRAVNLDHVSRIAADAGVPIQLGGGLRDADSVAAAFAAGASRVVLGTGAVESPALVEELVLEYGERIAVGVDARGGRVAVAGWEAEIAAEPAALVRALSAQGVHRFVYTPIEVDGTMQGPVLDGLRGIANETDAELVYSGGVGGLDDLSTLRRAGVPNLGGVIVGRALYEGRITVAEGQAVLDG